MVANAGEVGELGDPAAYTCDHCQQGADEEEGEFVVVEVVLVVDEVEERRHQDHSQVLTHHYKA